MKAAHDNKFWLTSFYCKKKVNLCQGNGRTLLLSYTWMRIIMTNNSYIFKNDGAWITMRLNAKLLNILIAKIASWKLLEQKLTHFIRSQDRSI